MTLDELSCKIECQDVLAHLCALLDEGSNAGAAELFTEDARYVAHAGAKSMTLAGAQLLDFVRNRPKTNFTRHLITNVHIEPLDQHSAKGRLCIIVYLVKNERGEVPPLPLPATPIGVADWNLRFRRTRQGWRIAGYDETLVFESAA